MGVENKGFLQEELDEDQDGAAVGNDEQLHEHFHLEVDKG